MDQKKSTKKQNQKKEEEAKLEFEEKKKEDLDPIEGINRLREIGLKKVSDKTFINLENLNMLLNREFEQINQTKAFGFIHILQRDFGVDLSALKQEYIDYKNRGKKRNLLAKKIHPPKNPKPQQETTELNRPTTTPKAKPTQTTIKKEPQEVKKRLKVEPSDFPSSNSLKKYLPLLLLPLIGYAIYSLTNKTGDNKLDDRVLDLNVVKNDNITKEVKENLIALEEEENQSKDELKEDDIDLNKVVKEIFNDDLNSSEEIATQQDETDSTAKETTQAVTDTEQTNSETNETDNKLDENAKKTLASLQETKKLLDSPAEEENVSLENVEKQASDEKNSTKEQEAVKNEEVSTNSNQKEPQKAKEEPKPKKPAKANKVASSIPSGIFIKPTQKAWVGVIYLDTMQKKDYLVKHYLKLNPKRDQIILIGHRHFKIYNHQHEVKFRSKRMVRFFYQGGKLREISKDEYIRRSGGVTW